MPVDYEGLLKSFRKKPLFDPASLAAQVCIGTGEIERIIPQRSPILLVDEISALAPADGCIAGSRVIPADDPVFRGHFPGYPIYPGTYTLEMIGQIGLCLNYFLSEGVSSVAENAFPAPVRATRILGALFLEPIKPGDRVLLLSKITENDGFFARAIGQALVNEKICCVSAAEICLL